MKFYQRAFKYVVRQKKKSVLLGSIFFVSLFICLTGISILRVTHEMMVNIAANSNAFISIFPNDFFSNEIEETTIEKIQAMENIQTVNRLNRMDVPLNDYFDMGPPIGEVFGVEFFFTGMDDLSLDGVFAHQTKRLEEGTLEVSGHQVVMDAGIVASQGWEIGTVLPFKLEEGDVIEVTIVGTYEIFDPNNRESGFRIYASPELVNEFQGDELYSQVQFFVRVPSEIEKTEEEIEQMIKDTDYAISVNDALYQRMSSSMKGVSSLMETLLMVTVGASGFIVSLLLSLWVRERRKEAGLLLSIGESKVSIMAQRLLEVFVIFMVSFVGLAFTNSLLITPLGNLIYGLGEVQGLANGQLENPEFYLTVLDLVQTLGIGSVIIFIAITISTIPLLKSHPKSILTSID